MASIRREIDIAADPESVWAALCDWGGLHRSLAPGFVTDTQLDGNDRLVTFFNGTTVREVLLDLDEDAQRLAWTIVDGPYRHHNGAAQVFVGAGGTTRFVWVTDLLPDEAAAPTAEMMDQSLAAIAAHLGA